VLHRVNPPGGFSCFLLDWCLCKDSGLKLDDALGLPLVEEGPL
jgi:hypothetical protein